MILRHIKVLKTRTLNSLKCKPDCVGQEKEKLICVLHSSPLHLCEKVENIVWMDVVAVARILNALKYWGDSVRWIKKANVLLRV